jgi:hypothetical protein
MCSSIFHLPLLFVCQHHFGTFEMTITRLVSTGTYHYLRRNALISCHRRRWAQDIGELGQGYGVVQIVVNGTCHWIRKRRHSISMQLFIIISRCLQNHRFRTPNMYETNYRLFELPISPYERERQKQHTFSADKLHLTIYPLPETSANHCLSAPARTLGSSLTSLTTR